MSQRGRTLRRFHCRRDLWPLFARLADERDCSVDDLINQAMEAFAAQQGRSVPREGVDDVVTAELALDDAPTPTPGSWGGRALCEDSHTKVVAVRPASPRAVGETTTATWSPLQPRVPTSGTHPAASSRPLYLVFGDQRILVDGDQFVIGRGSKVSDFVIKDPNISRRHAAVLRRNGVYHIQDLGSTNGIEYNGMRIDNKRIDEGDVFRICEHELRFSYSDEAR